MAREDPHFRLRIPEELKARIEQAAAENGRSMTAEIVHRLDKSFNSKIDLENLDENVGELWRRVDDLEAAVQDIRDYIRGR